MHRRTPFSDDRGLFDDRNLRAAYALHAAALYRFAFRELGDPGIAQDAVQETFLRAWRSSAAYDPAIASLRVWLFAIARNVTIDLRRRRRTGSYAQVVPDGTVIDERLPPEADRTDAVLTREVVKRALGRISREHREVIVETHLRGRTYDELAASTGVSAGTLRSRVFYALKALRAAMDEMGVSL